MEQSTTLNGSNNAVSQDKKQSKPTKKIRNLPSLNSFGSASSMRQVSYNGLVSDTPIDFSGLKNYEIFSLNADGSFPMLRVSCSKAISLHDRGVHLCSSGRCYRISLNAHPAIELKNGQAGKE